MEDPLVSGLDRAVMVGRVGPRRARLWLRSSGGGRHRLELWQEGAPDAPVALDLDVPELDDRDGTWAFKVPDDCDGGRPLEPSTRYRFRVTAADGAPVGEGRFETAPQDRRHTPSRFCFGFGSCHQPFDEGGAERPLGLQMLLAARSAFEACGVKFNLWLGDQLYADYPETLSLFDPDAFRRLHPELSAQTVLQCTAEEALAVYHRRYRWAWRQPQWLALHSEWPSYPLLDDHEVADNFGSLPRHEEEDYQRVRGAALLAYRHYQQARVGPPSPAGAFDYGFDYGSVGFYLLDVRTRRRAGADARIFGEGQLEALHTWLEDHGDAPVVFLGVPVPLFFMPPWAAKLITAFRWSEFADDGYDRFTHPQYLEDHLRLLELLRAHQRRRPAQKVVVLSGDVHVGYAARCDWRVPEGAQLYQLVSSPLSHEMERPGWGHARHVPRIHFHTRLPGPDARIHLMDGAAARLHTPIAALNVGVVEVDLGDPKAPTVRFRLFGVEEGGHGRPRHLFEVAF